MARAGAWALLLGALGCSELKAGNWMPDAATMADGGTAVDAGAMTLDAGAMTLDAGAMVADAAALVDSGPPCPRDRLRGGAARAASGCTAARAGCSAPSAATGAAAELRFNRGRGCSARRR
jgi:hypothetical protein